MTQYLFYISYNSCDASTSSMRFRLYCILTIFIQLDSNIGHAGRSLVVTAYYHFLIYYIACSYRAYVSIAQKSRRLLRECILCTAWDHHVIIWCIVAKGEMLSNSWWESFSISCSKLWNNLPANIHNIDSQQPLKRCWKLIHFQWLCFKNKHEYLLEN